MCTCGGDGLLLIKVTADVSVDASFRLIIAPIIGAIIDSGETIP